MQTHSVAKFLSTRILPPRPSSGILGPDGTLGSRGVQRGSEARSRFPFLGDRDGRVFFGAAFVLVCLLMSPVANGQPFPPEESLQHGTYVHLLATASVGDSLRFNNPYRLSHQLGRTGESVSRTPPYSNLGLGAALGNPDGVQHGLSLQWSASLSGISQSVLAPAYLLVLDGLRPWLFFGRAGLPIVLNPTPGVGGEVALGGSFLFTAGLGLQAELVGNIFYGAATWEKTITAIPMLSLQLGIIIDIEVLP